MRNLLQRAFVSIFSARPVEIIERNPPSEQFQNFYATATAWQTLKLLCGWPVVMPDEVVYRICSKHGPFADLVRGYEPTNMRYGDCPNCQAMLARAHSLRCPQVRPTM